MKQQASAPLTEDVGAWRQWFKSRESENRGTGVERRGGRAPRGRSDDFAATEWLDTQWADTRWPSNDTER